MTYRIALTTILLICGQSGLAATINEISCPPSVKVLAHQTTAPSGWALRDMRINANFASKSATVRTTQDGTVSNLQCVYQYTVGRRLHSTVITRRASGMCSEAPGRTFHCR